jgi:hypothetical protein
MEIMFALVGYVMCKFSTRLIMNYPFPFLVPSNSLLETKIGIIRLISFLREFVTHLTMIQSHVESMFQTLFGLSIRVFPSY